MNLRIFNKLMKETRLKQQPLEWKLFLEFCSMYLKSKRTKHPVVVELSLGEGKQREYWTQLFDAEYIDVDATGNHKALIELKRKLGKRRIDILFIDASRLYHDVKRNYEFYSPLCDGLVVLQGIETFRNTGRKSAEIWKFWDDLKREAREGPAITIFHKRSRGCQRGIGVILKK